MKAITIQQPWAWAICHAGKRIENRAWHNAPGLLAQARRLVGQRIAIHAAKGMGKRSEFHAAAERVIEIVGAEKMARLPAILSDFKGRWSTANDVPRGAVVAVATLAALARTLDNGCRIPEGNIVASCMLCRGMLPSSEPCSSADPWAIPGTIGLVLADVSVLTRSAPHKGAQGFFEIPDGAPCGSRS